MKDIDKELDKQIDEPNLDEQIDGILEEVHNSWLEDDYEYDDPCGVHAKNAIKALIATQINQARITELELLLPKLELMSAGMWDGEVDDEVELVQERLAELKEEN